MGSFEYPRDFKGVWIPWQVYLDPELLPLEKILLTEIDSLDHTSEGGEGCWASNEYLASFCQCGHATIERALKKLSGMGLIREQGYRNRSKVWTTSLKMRELPPSKRGKYDPQNEGQDNIGEKYTESKKGYAPSVNMTEQEHEKLCAKYGRNATGLMIEKLSAFKESKGKRYKSDYRAILSWVVDWAKQERYIEDRAGDAQRDRAVKTDPETQRILDELKVRNELQEKVKV